MPRARKTIPVKDLVDWVNSQLATRSMTREEQSVLCILLENILHKTGNYAGFKWTSLYDPELHDIGGREYWRRHYYYSPTLKGKITNEKDRLHNDG